MTPGSEVGDEMGGVQWFGIAQSKSNAVSWAQYECARRAEKEAVSRPVMRWEMEWMASSDSDCSKQTRCGVVGAKLATRVDVAGDKPGGESDIVGVTGGKFRRVLADKRTAWSALPFPEAIFVVIMERQCDVAPEEETGLVARIV
jgi:hypothetical protein